MCSFRGGKKQALKLGVFWLIDHRSDQGEVFMTVTCKHLLLSAFLACLGTALPTAVFAYNGWNMQSDVGTINQLAAEGAINPVQAQYLDNRAANRAYGGPLSNFFNGGSIFGPTLTPGAVGFQSGGQIRREDRQINKLERDGMISRRQGNTLKKELWMNQNAMYNGFAPTAGIMQTGFMPATGIMPVATSGLMPTVLSSTSMLAPMTAQPVVAPQVANGVCGHCAHHAAWLASHGLLNTAVQPVVAPTAYNDGYYTTSASGTILNHLHNYWH